MVSLTRPGQQAQSKAARPPQRRQKCKEREYGHDNTKTAVTAGTNKGLTPAEEILLEKAQKGQCADFKTGITETDQLRNAGDWGDDRCIRAELLYWLCTNTDADQLVHAKGVRICGAKVEGQLDFAVATLLHPLWLRDCVIREKITFRRAQTRDIDFSGSQTGPISADRLTTQGDVFLRGSLIKGEVRLLGANISGDLSCTDAQFENPGRNALIADRLTTHGNVYLRGVHVKGAVRLLGAKICGDLRCTGATFENTEDTALNAEGLIVKGSLFWHSMKKRPGGVINLMHAKVGPLEDDAASWPHAGNLRLEGFEYEAFVGESPHTATERLRWLNLQPSVSFHPQPYEQLATVFRRMGSETDAREVLIAKQEARRKYGNLGRLSMAWNRLLGITIAHGYKPWRVMWFMIVMIPVGSAVFWYGHECLGVINQVQKGAPPFNPFIYSLEVFVPLVDLHQERYWLANSSGTLGALIRVYLWLHIILGWVSSTLLAAALTGLVRKE